MEVIKAIKPLNYRTVVSFNFDKITNLEYWDLRILEFYNNIMKHKIHESFIGLRININEKSEIMLKLNVRYLNIDAIRNFYFNSQKFGNVVSLYYENDEKIYFVEGKESINIYINDVEIPITPNSFIQANHEMGNILYKNVNDLVKPNENLIIYGRNSFHIASQIHKKFKNIICVNPCKIAFNDGLKYIEQNNYNWKTINSKEDLVGIINGCTDDTTIILSPGRNGYTYFEKINLEKFKDKQVVYITCNEETMKRDLKIEKNNFIIKKNIMIELFPGTKFNENIVELEYK
jgi:tRNA/tmRNA/rRNA uracil-C5-methylase (TrmA/RlmC/RlmD family)